MKNNTAQATKVITAHVPFHYLWLIKSTKWPSAWNAPGAGLSNRRFLHGLPAQEEERNRLTLEALDDVTSGQVIDHRLYRLGRTAQALTIRYRCHVDLI